MYLIIDGSVFFIIVENNINDCMEIEQPRNVIGNC